MNPDLLPDYFFETTAFDHAAIFENCLFVWEAFAKIDSYLHSLPLGKIEVKIPEGVYLENRESITILNGTVLEPGAYIKGPCFIGRKCTIRHGAYIRGDLIAGDECIIGHGTEIKNSILLNKAHAAHFAYVGDSILGNNVNLGAGTVCANLRLDRKNISIHLNHQKYDSGLHKFGAIIGDNSQLGCNTVTNPGTLIGKCVFSYPCLNLGSFIPEHQIVKANFTNNHMEK